MDEEQLNKMGDYFNKKYEEETSKMDNLQADTEVVGHMDSHDLGTSSRVENLYAKFDNFTSDDFGSHKKCRKITQTKWDKFAPYAFSKLDKDAKIETFLQLFEDYNNLKLKLNEQIDKNKKLTAKMVYFQAQIAKIKTNSALSPADRIRLQKQKNKQVEGMKVQIKRLHQKIIALTGSSHKIVKRPSTAKNKTATKHLIPVNQNVKAELQAEKKQVRQLLLIIDELKKTKYELQDQLKDKQKNNASMVRGNHNISKVGGANKNTESQFYEYTNELMNWKQKYNDMQLIFNRAMEDKDKQIKDISSQLINLKENERMKSKVERRAGHFDISETGKLQQRIRDLTDENEKLQTQLRRLVKMPFYQNNTQILDQQKKLSQIQMKYHRVKEDLSKSNETSMKYFAQLEYKSKQNTMLKEENEKMKKQIRANFEKQQTKTMGSVTGQIDYDDYYRRQLHLVKLEGDDPVWRKFSIICKPEFHSMTEKQLREEADKLWCSKIELLAHLEKAHIELASIKQNMDSRINLYAKDKQFLEEQLRVTRARLDEWMSMERMNVRRDFQVYEQAGVKYDDTVSVFDVEQAEIKELESNQNYFDLYLGHINIDESMLLKNPQNKIKNTSHFVSFLTVDFYNHQTQHSDFAEGVVKNLANNYSFKVEVSSYYLKYLSKNAINLELWSPQGTATVLLGKGKIYLSQLISKATKEISNVIRGKCQIYFNDKFLIASVEYRIRMRLPISPFIQWAQSKNQFTQNQVKNPLALGKKKVLGISVERAEGLPATIKAFVYFSVQNEDFFSEPERGPSPLWDFHCEVPVTVDEQFTDELKQKYFQFTIFDDDKEVNEDVYGIAKANLTPLVDSMDCLNLALDIQNKRGQFVGKLKVKAEWMNA